MKLTPELKIKTLALHLMRTNQWVPQIGELVTSVGNTMTVFRIEQIDPSEVTTTILDSGDTHCFAAIRFGSHVAPVPPAVLAELTADKLKLVGMGRAENLDPSMVLCQYNRTPTDAELKEIRGKLK